MARFITARCEAAPESPIQIRVDLTGREYQILAAGPDYVSEKLRATYREYLTAIESEPAQTGNAEPDAAAAEAHAANVRTLLDQIEAQQAEDQQTWAALLSKVYGQQTVFIKDLALDLSTPDAVLAVLVNDELDYLLRGWLIKAPTIAMDVELESIRDNASKLFGRASN